MVGSCCCVETRHRGPCSENTTRLIIRTFFGNNAFPQAFDPVRSSALNCRLRKVARKQGFFWSWGCGGRLRVDASHFRYCSSVRAPGCPFLARLPAHAFCSQFWALARCTEQGSPAVAAAGRLLVPRFNRCALSLSYVPISATLHRLYLNCYCSIFAPEQNALLRTLTTP